MKTSISLQWEAGGCHCLLRMLLPTCIHPKGPVDKTIPQPTPYIYLFPPLPSFLFFWFPSFLVSRLPPPRLLQCLPELWETYPPGHARGQTCPIGLKKKEEKKKDRQKKKEAPPKSYWARCLLTHWPPGVDAVVFVCRCILRQQVKTAYCNTSISTKFSNSFLCSVYCISSSVSFYLPPLVWSVTKFLARLHCWKSPPPLLASFLLPWQKHTYAQTYIVLHASAKSQQFSAEPVLFLGGTLILVAALCVRLMGGIEQ